MSRFQVFEDRLCRGWRGLLSVSIILAIVVTTCLSVFPPDQARAALASSLPALGTIRVRVWAEDDGNRQLDPGEWPVADASVFLSPLNDGPELADSTDRDGVCEFDVESEDSYQVRVSPPDGYVIVYPPDGQAISAVGADQVTELDFVLQALFPVTPTATRTATEASFPDPTPVSEWERQELVIQYGVSGYPNCEGAGCYTAIADTYLQAWRPDEIQITNASLYLEGRPGQGTLKFPLMQFDLFRIPEEARIISATLSLWSESKNGSDLEAGVYRLLRPVVASEASWKNARKGEPWTVAGCEGLGTDRAAVPETTQILSDQNMWYTFPLTELVQTWVSDPDQDHGVVIKPTAAEDAGYQFRFTASWSPMQAHRPKLTVIYEAPRIPFYERFGLGVVSTTSAAPGVRREIEDYDMRLLRSGWYSDWWFDHGPDGPDEMKYVQLARVRDLEWNADFFWSGIEYALLRQPGSLWIIGNEPEDVYQENCTPTKYVERYHELYTFIKTHDPSARIAIGGVVMPTPVRLRWLEMVLDAYDRRYGEPMPIDVWNIHVQILPEEGFRVPVGVDDLSDTRSYATWQNASFATFVQLVTEFRQWMKEKGFQSKPLIISEYGVLYPSSMLSQWNRNDNGYGDKVLNDFMTLTFDYLLQARDTVIGNPRDDHRLVQRWLWYSLNDHPYDPSSGGGFNGSLYKWQDPAFPGTLTTFGANYVRYMHALDDPPTVGMALETHGEMDWTLQPEVSLSLWADDLSTVQRIAISNEPGSMQIRQTFAEGDSLGDPPPNPPPLDLAKAKVIKSPMEMDLQLSWDLTDPIYGGNSDYGAKTVYVRFQDQEGVWSRLYLQTVHYRESAPTPTPSATGTDQPPTTTTITPSPTWTATPSFSPTKTATPSPSMTATETPSPTPTTGQLCVRVFEDANGDYIYQEESERLLEGATIELLNTDFETLTSVVTSRLTDPLCLSSLPAGNYYLRQTPPAGYTTALAYFSVPVVANRTLVVSLPAH